jgi:hypothetical protein
MRKTDYPNQDFEPSFDAYRAQRGELVSVLRGLSSDQWSSAATVTGLYGGPQLRSVLDYAQQLARHEQVHLEQIGSIVKTVHP